MKSPIERAVLELKVSLRPISMSSAPLTPLGQGYQGDPRYNFYQEESYRPHYPRKHKQKAEITEVAEGPVNEVANAEVPATEVLSPALLLKFYCQPCY